MFRTVLLAASAAAALLPLAGCGGADARGDSGGGVDVVASVYPLAWMSERIVGDAGTVTDLTTPGQEPHDLELSVQRTAELEDADLVVYAADLQPAVDEAVQDADEARVAEARDAVATRSPAIPGPRPPQAFDGDPHVWLDPRAMATVAEQVRDRLVALAPQSAAGFRSRTAALVADLRQLDERSADALRRCARRTLVVSHGAYAAFGYRYDLDLEPITGLSPDAEPSAARLVELADLIDRQDITTVFAERLGSPEVVESLAAETGTQVAVLDPIEGLTDETADEDYLSLMREDVAAVAAANDCSAGES